VGGITFDTLIALYQNVVPLLWPTDLQKRYQRASEAMKYITVTADNSVELDARVNENLAEGWKLHGGAAVAAMGYAYENGRKGGTESYSEWCFMQAMTLESKREP